MMRDVEEAVAKLLQLDVNELLNNSDTRCPTCKEVMGNPVALAGGPPTPSPATAH